MSHTCTLHPGCSFSAAISSGGQCQQAANNQLDECSSCYCAGRLGVSKHPASCFWTEGPCSHSECHTRCYYSCTGADIATIDDVPAAATEKLQWDTKEKASKGLNIIFVKKECICICSVHTEGTPIQLLVAQCMGLLCSHA